MSAKEAISGMTIFGVPRQPFIPFAVLIKALETVFILASVHTLRIVHSTNTTKGET
jgi:hypothetical protein